MGSKNFRTPHTKGVYTIMPREEDRFNEFWYDDVKDDVLAALSARGVDINSFIPEYYKNTLERDTIHLGTLEKEIFGGDVYIGIYCLMESGYYEGVQLDIGWDVWINGYTYDETITIEDLQKDFECFDIDVIDAEQLYDVIIREVDRLRELVEGIYRDIVDNY